jgi:hypothetical protein
VALLALCACNQVYDLSSTRVRDAPEPDALPLACPAPPAVPQFAHELTQAFGDCQYFNIDATGTVAMATCNGEHRIGPPDGPLVADGLANALTSAPRPGPGGTHVYLTYSLGPAVMFEVFEKSDGMWSAKGTLPFAGGWLSNVAVDRDGNEHVLVESNGTIEEWMLTSDTWKPQRMFDGGDLETGIAIAPMISGDGLRLVVRGMDALGNAAMYYAARSRVDEAFGTGERLADVPVPDDLGAFLTNDCTRIYVSGLQQVFYLRQR